MNGNAIGDQRGRFTGLLTRSRPGSARPMPPAKSAARVPVLPAARDDSLYQELMDWAPTFVRIPWLEGADYQYRLGSHQLLLAIRGVTDRQEAAVGRDEAEFALVVEGPLLVFGCRFGVTLPWCWTTPYNWHFAPPAERVVPAAVPVTPETYARLWTTLWITLVDTATGRARIRRAVALRPAFTHALHGALRERAMRPFQVAAACRALDGLQCAACSLDVRACVMTKCAPVSDCRGRWASTRAGRDGVAHYISMRKPMSHDPGNSIVITDGYWMHIPQTRIYHRRYPEARGEGRSLADAASHLVNQLTRSLDFAHGREREAVERAVADVRALPTSRPRHRPGALAVVP
jgi:hypothetical protein